MFGAAAAVSATAIAATAPARLIKLVVDMTILLFIQPRPARAAARRRLIAAVAVIAVIPGIPMMGAPPIAAPGLLTPFVSAPPLFAPLAVLTPAVLLGLSRSGSRECRDDAKGGEGCDSLTHG